MAVGFPLAVGDLFENSQLQAIALFAARIGEVYLGTHNSMISLFLFLTSSVFGFKDGAVTRIGKYLGAGDPALARIVAWVGSVCIGVVGVVTASLMIILHQYLGRIYSDDHDILSTFERISTIAALSYVFLTLFVTAMVNTQFFFSACLAADDSRSSNTSHAHHGGLYHRLLGRWRAKFLFPGALPRETLVPRDLAWPHRWVFRHRTGHLRLRFLSDRLGRCG